MFTCKFCNKDISSKPSNRRTFCNYLCFVLYQKKFHPKRVREKRICIICNKEFEVIKSDKKKFCSSSCSAIYNNKKRIYTIETKEKMKQAYKNGKLTGLKLGAQLSKQKAVIIEKECPICHKKFLIPKWEISCKNRKYCSKECSYKRPGQGGYRPGSVRSYKSGWYISNIAGKVWLDSSYEFVMAKYLDSKNYQWIKNHKGFPYIKSDGSGSTYIPDFYVKDLDLWIETKGYMVDNDNRKIQQFPHKIILITKKEIYNQSKWGF